MEGIGKGLVTVIVIMIIFFMLVTAAGYTVVNRFFIDHSIKSDHLIKPEIKLVIEDNKVDTIYIYKHPK